MTQLEQLRVENLLSILPPTRQTILEIGARHGKVTRLLTSRFPEITALDLIRPSFDIDGVTTVQGDVQNLNFADESFDCVICTEVLEHVDDVKRACSEISRVARHEILIGVPYRQDTRVGRLTCDNCGLISPPYGHVNIFDEQILNQLFTGLKAVKRAFVGQTIERTNFVSAWLMDRAGNPWANYAQEEPCIHCGKEFSAGVRASTLRRVFSRAAHLLNEIQRRHETPQPIWIHLLYSKIPLFSAVGSEGGVQRKTINF